MAWWSLRMDGMVLDSLEEAPVNLMVGTSSLASTVFRLHQRLEQVVDARKGVIAPGLRAAVVAQLALGQWECWSSYRNAELEPLLLPPPVRASLLNTRSSGSSSRKRSTPPASPDS